MSSREAGRVFNWRQLLVIGAPIAFSIAVVATGYLYYSRNKRKGRDQEIHSSDDAKKEKKGSSPRPLTPSPENEEEAAALKLLLEKKAEANNFFSNKEYERAVELYTQLIEECSLPALRPDLSKIYHNRAVTFEKIKGEGYLERVIEDCNKAIEIDPKYVKARARRAKAFEEVGDLMSCLKDWTVVNLLQPEVANSDASFHRIDQLISNRGKQLAIEKMKTLVMLLPSKIQIEELIGVFSDFGIYTDATLLELYRIETCQRPVSVSPLSPISTEPAENGVTLTDTSDTDSLETSNTDVNNSSAVSEGSPEELRKRLELEPFWQAVFQMRSRQYSSVVELTSQAIDTGCRVFKTHALLVRATFYLILNKHTQAIHDVNVILTDENTAPQMRISALLRRACAREAKDEFKPALEDFEMALSIDPNNHTIFLVRSKFYSSEDNPDFDKAQEDINKCLQLRPDDNLAGRNFYAMLKFKLASSSQSQVEMEKVKRHLRETMKQFPNSPETMGLYSQVLLDVLEIREALEYLDKAIQLDPHNGTLFVYRAQARMSNKGGAPNQGFPIISNPHLEEATIQAMEELEYALKIDGQCILAMEVLATMYSQRGETDRAVKYLEMAIKHVRTLNELAQLQTFLLIITFQPEINKEIQACGFDPETLQNSLNRLQLL